jgi:MFS family permease
MGGQPAVPVAASAAPFGAPFWRYLAVLVLFTLGNSTDAFLLLRASQLGIAPALLPILWAALHVVKSATSIPAGAWSDRVGRRTMIAAGWLWYALVYLGFALATETWHAWALFLSYGLFFGLTEGVERALVADLVPATRRGIAFGWYNGVIGAAVLPASVVFGLMWDWKGSGFAFMVGAASACLAAVGLALVRPVRTAGD